MLTVETKNGNWTDFSGIRSMDKAYKIIFEYYLLEGKSICFSAMIDKRGKEVILVDKGRFKFAQKRKDGKR